MLKRVAIGTKLDIIILMIKVMEDKNTSGVISKITKSVTVQKEIIKRQKRSIKEAMMISRDLVDVVYQASLKLAG